MSEKNNPTRKSSERRKVVVFVFVADLTKQVLFLLDAGKRRVPVKVVGAVRLSSKDWGAPSTVGCRRRRIQ